MGVVKIIFLVLHFVGLASLLGGYLFQMRAEKKLINSGMLHGVLTQLVSGLALVGLLEAADDTVDHTKIGVKLGITVVIGILVFLNRKKSEVAPAVWNTIGGLTLVNVILAVAW